MLGGVMLSHFMSLKLVVVVTFINNLTQEASQWLFFISFRWLHCRQYKCHAENVCFQVICLGYNLEVFSLSSINFYISWWSLFVAPRLLLSNRDIRKRKFHKDWKCFSTFPNCRLIFKLYLLLYSNNVGHCNNWNHLCDLFTVKLN